MTAQTAADLRAAADVLERDGWTQGAYRNNDGCRCVMGAIAAAVTNGAYDGPRWAVTGADDGTRDFWKRHNAANDALAKHIDDPLTFQWNDTEGRTADQVIAALRATADAAERA